MRMTKKQHKEFDQLMKEWKKALLVDKDRKRADQLYKRLYSHYIYPATYPNGPFGKPVEHVTKVYNTEDGMYYLLKAYYKGTQKFVRLHGKEMKLEFDYEWNHFKTISTKNEEECQ